MSVSEKITCYDASVKRLPPHKILRGAFQSIIDGHELAMRFTIRNIKAQYRQSVLGIMWALIPPLATAVIWIFLKGQGVVDLGETNIPYPVFIICGTLLWQIFSEGIMASLKSVSTNKTLLSKVNIPRESLLISGFYEVAFNSMIKIILFVGVMLVFGILPSTYLLLFPVGIICLMMAGFSIGLILTPLGLLYRDVERGVPVILPFLMFLSPVIYPMPQGDGALSWILKLNPASSLIDVTRNWFVGLPGNNLDLFLIHMTIVFCLLLLGLIIFRLAIPIVVERISN